jgi:choice-of-anchor A domain-containing protein
LNSGRALIGGNAVLQDFTIGNEVNTRGDGAYDHRRPFSFVVNGDLCWSSGSLFPDGSNRPEPSFREDLRLSGTWSKGAEGCESTPIYLRQRVGMNYPNYSRLDDELADMQDRLRELSQLLKDCPNSQTATSSSLYGGLWFSGPSEPEKRRYCATVQIATWNQHQWRAFQSLDPEAEWVVNLVGGPSDQVIFEGAQWPGIGDHALFNIPGGQDILIRGGHRGHILAVDSELEQPYGVANGLVVVGSVKSLIQINRPHCGCRCCSICQHEEQNTVSLASSIFEGLPKKPIVDVSPAQFPVGMKNFF